MDSNISARKRSSLKYHNQLFNDPNLKFAKIENKHLQWGQKVEEHTIETDIKTEEQINKYIIF